CMPMHPSSAHQKRVDACGVTDNDELGLGMRDQGELCGRNDDFGPVVATHRIERYRWCRRHPVILLPARSKATCHRVSAPFARVSDAARQIKAIAASQCAAVRDAGCWSQTVALVPFTFIEETLPDLA